MKLRYLALAAFVALPATAFAQAVDLEAFSRLDVNSDNMISSDEAQANQRLATDFGTIDLNADGNLTSDEYNSAYDQPEGRPAMPQTPPNAGGGDPPHGPPEGVPSRQPE